MRVFQQFDNWYFAYMYTCVTSLQSLVLTDATRAYNNFLSKSPTPDSKHETSFPWIPCSLVNFQEGFSRFETSPIPSNFFFAFAVVFDWNRILYRAVTGSCWHQNFERTRDILTDWCQLKRYLLRNSTVACSSDWQELFWRPLYIINLFLSTYVTSPSIRA